MYSKNDKLIKRFAIFIFGNLQLFFIFKYYFNLNIAKKKQQKTKKQ